MELACVKRTTHIQACYGTNSPTSNVICTVLESNTCLNCLLGGGGGGDSPPEQRQNSNLNGGLRKAETISSQPASTPVLGYSQAPIKRDTGTKTAGE